MRCFNDSVPFFWLIALTFALVVGVGACHGDTTTNPERVTVTAANLSSQSGDSAGLATWGVTETENGFLSSDCYSTSQSSMVTDTLEFAYDTLYYEHFEYQSLMGCIEEVKNGGWTTISVEVDGEVEWLPQVSGDSRDEVKLYQIPSDAVVEFAAQAAEGCEFRHYQRGAQTITENPATFTTIDGAGYFGFVEIWFECFDSPDGGDGGDGGTDPCIICGE